MQTSSPPSREVKIEALLFFSSVKIHRARLGTDKENNKMWSQPSKAKVEGRLTNDVMGRVEEPMALTAHEQKS